MQFSVPHTPSERVRWVSNYGHQWNPNCPNLHNLDSGRVAMMDGSEKDAKEMIASWQLLDGNVEGQVRIHHNGRDLIPDGDVGPASISVMALPRCDVPDYAPPPNVALHDDNPERLRMLLKYQAAKEIQQATGSGSWPHACFGTAGLHEIKVSYDETGLSDNQKLWLPEIKKHNAAGVAAFGLKVIEVPVGQFANVRFFMRNYGGSTIGMAEFNSGECGDSCFCTVTNRYAPNLVMFLILVMHEFGHTMNFEHSNGYIMNPSIMKVPEYWVTWSSAGLITYQDVRYTKGKQFFGGLPLTQPAPPPPVVHPPVSGSLFGEQFGNRIVIRGGVKFDNKWSYIAEPDGVGGSRLVASAVGGV